MARARRLLVAVAVLVGLAVVDPPKAVAACHAFEFESVSPASVAEGGTVTVTVSRDGNIGQSSVQVTSINGTAQAGQDFPAVQRTVTMSTLTATFTVPTTNDSAPESAETFSLHLSNGAGCANTDYRYGPDATITIQDNDAAPAPAQPTTPATAPPTAAPTTARATTTTLAATTTTVAGETTTTIPETTTSDVGLAAKPVADADEDGGGGGGTALLALLALALAGAVGYVGYTLYRRRTT